MRLPRRRGGVRWTASFAGTFTTTTHRMIGAIRYLNCGDWVESRTAVAEDHNGQLRVIHWDGVPAAARLFPRRFRFRHRGTIARRGRPGYNNCQLGRG